MAATTATRADGAWLTISIPNTTPESVAETTRVSRAFPTGSVAATTTIQCWASAIRSWWAATPEHFPSATTPATIFPKPTSTTGAGLTSARQYFQPTKPSAAVAATSFHTVFTNVPDPDPTAAVPSPDCPDAASAASAAAFQTGAPRSIGVYRYQNWQGFSQSLPA